MNEMERNVKISLEKAIEWYRGEDNSLKEIALQSFTKEELERFNYTDIKTFADALNYANKYSLYSDLVNEYYNCTSNSYSEKVCKLRIIIAVLTNNEERFLTTGDYWYPVIQFYQGKVNGNYTDKVIGTIKSKGIQYSVICNHAYKPPYTGLGLFNWFANMSATSPLINFISVSSKEIAQHISMYFGHLLFETIYGGTNCDWEWV